MHEYAKNIQNAANTSKIDANIFKLDANAVNYNRVS